MKLTHLFESYNPDNDNDLRDRNQEYKQLKEPPAYPVSERVDSALGAWDLVRGLFNNINTGLIQYYFDQLQEQVQKPERAGEELAILIHVINRRYRDAIACGAKTARGLGLQMPKPAQIPSYEAVLGLLKQHIQKFGPQGDAFLRAFMRMYAVFDPANPEEN